ncbi:MAG TPA: RHS repeat-associated core domain-containing protein [Ktedonobacteraceae bacterium]|nr:RHS repeat-associated core domain-containing protein [Ktedonobacteraceae bacterium]
MRLASNYSSVRHSSGTMPTTYNFTGQRLDSETGLLYYNFRYYDPVSGRFVRADTVQNNAGGKDPYAYVGDSPEGRTDPTGHCWPWCTALIGAVVGAAVSVAVTAVTDAAQGKTPSAGELLQAAVVGGVSGAIVGVVGPEAGPLARVAVGALASGVGQMAGNAIAGKPVMDGVGQAVIAGAITGGLAEGLGAVFSGSSGDAVDSAVLDVEAGCGLSFRADTVVATARGEQEIGTLKVGEQVWSYNPQMKKMELEPIQHIWLNHDVDLVDLTLVATVEKAHDKPTKQDELIHTNEKHPFLTKEKGFIPVSQLKLGMHVLEANGSYGVVAKLVVVPGAMWMYNLTVAQDHTYAVGLEQWIVHNCGRTSGDIVQYSDKATGFQNHHGVLDVWATNNISGYVSRAPDGPSIALTITEHDATKAVYRQWLYEQTGKFVGASVDWTNVPVRETLNLSERMFDAAGVSDEARLLYYRAFNQYIYTGSWRL